MNAIQILRGIYYECTSFTPHPRIPETDLIMAAEEQVRAYSEATRVDGIMSPIYLLYALMVSKVVRPNDTILDLGCGAGNHLHLVAKWNPKTKFVGIDLSEQMLKTAEANIRRANIQNVEFQHGDMTQLKLWPSHSTDGVISSLALHHLPHTEALIACYKEMNRVVKPTGSFAILDFEHLKSSRSIEIFAQSYRGQNSEIFELDYLNSLRAAFVRSDIQRAVHVLNGRAQLRHMPFLPFMYTLSSKTTRELSGETLDQMKIFLRSLPREQRDDFRALTFFLGLTLR